ncbi:MAG: CarD family transcriptional regulator [Clostridiales bacterium]|nr:CarD family transcriptional regulator [Clostridiales bacterium]
MYNIGDKVVYPMHGAGVIEDIEEREILGSKQNYYVLRIPVGSMKILVPISKMEEIGIRDLSDESLVEDVFSVFQEEPMYSKESNWNKRYRDNMIKLKTGDILNVASVVQGLMIRERDKGLSTGEKKMLSNAKQILESEIVLIKGWKQDHIDRMLYDYIYNNRAKAQ